MSFDAERSEFLHIRVRALVRAFEQNRPLAETFDALGVDILRHQAEHIPGYARLCARHGVDLSTITTVAECPAVPTDAFKRSRVAAHPPSLDTITFRTSGTSAGPSERGQHAIRNVTTYEHASLAFGRNALMRDFPARVPIFVLGPTPNELPDSSLTHMFETFVRELGEPVSADETYFLSDGVFELSAMDERVSRVLARGGESALLLGTSWAFAKFLDAVDPDVFRMPLKTRLMQTGGFKGRTKEIPEATLRKELARMFAIDPNAILSEYGMTELGSQFYTQNHDGQPRYISPPWARVRAVDPTTLGPVARGEIGIARIEDLVNVDSACIVLTQDRIRESEDGTFELLGRLPGAPPRGCSLTLEEMFGS